MGIIKSNRNKNYTIMANYHLRDKSLSLAAKGLMSYMLSLPDTWEYSVAGLASVLCVGKCQIRAKVAELEKAGYLYRHKQTRNKKGLFEKTIDYDLYESPKDNPYFYTV